ncbi:hypothetical protein GCM10011352_04690 [Marinobacterium zhoushanense]|uniref:DNA 3'-5' helicase n=1 Tax=Marinobacterium zhoushanense TaxID=1679163 RepID=A0ABQ1K2L5_9GAMM|nr:hypothetical protein GCM10011352_04690 [Marinobacterium zhoushanense]
MFQWKENYLDVMVATSAFGVGMDKPDVRTIIHYGVPETLDRYYQDCGRSGRDGYASSCLMLYDVKDIDVAKSLATVKILTGEKARNRFNGLLESALDKRDDSYIIAPETIPPHLVYHGATNKSWNWKTVLLLQRMGVISLQLLSRDEYESVKKEDDPPYVGLKYIRMDILDYALYGADFWGSDFKLMKSRFSEINRSELNHIDRLLEPEVELCRLFGEYFKFAETYPEVICRGCTGHSEKRLHKVGKFPVSTLHTADLLTLYGSEPFGFELDENNLFNDLSSLVRLLGELCKKGQVKFVRCSQTVKYEILVNLPENSSIFIVFKDLDDPNFGPDEFTIFYETDAHSSGLPRDDIVSNSRFLLTDSNLKHWSGGTSVLERLQNVFVIDDLEGAHLGTL